MQYNIYVISQRTAGFSRPLTIVPWQVNIRFQGESQSGRKDKLPGKGAMTSEKERAIDLAPDGATNSIVPQAMTLVGDNDTPFVKARPEAGHGRFRLRWCLRCHAWSSLPWKESRHRCCEVLGILPFSNELTLSLGYRRGLRQIRRATHFSHATMRNKHFHAQKQC